MNKKQKRKQKRKLMFLFIILVVIIFKSGQAVVGNIDSKSRNSLALQNQICNFLMNKGNRLKAYNIAAKLNGGSTQNTCVYFLGEVLRQNGINVSKSICNTSQLISFLQNENWVKEKDYKKLKQGDICFTTDSYLNKDGIPSHTYVFMGWVNEGKYDFAYVCDNQAKDYKGKIYHIRNISVKARANGKDKDPFSFFMYKAP